MTISKLERYRGALVGELAGDALLAPYETWSGERVQEDLKKRGGLVPFDYPNPWREGGAIMPMGRPTDDSDQTAALAESLIANRGLNEEDLFCRLRKIVYEHVSPLWEGRATGAGKTTREALSFGTFAESQKRDTSGAYPSNGSLMRSAPMALYFGSKDRCDEDLVFRASRVTHEHELSCDCTSAYTYILIDLMHDRNPAETVQNYLPFFILEGVMLHPKDMPRDPGKWPERGHAGHTLHVAMWSLIHATDFRDGLTKVAMIGGDTDTYGAVAGGLLGAKFGIDGIPSEWRKVLKGHDKMIEYADALYAMAHLHS